MPSVRGEDNARISGKINVSCYEGVGASRPQKTEASVRASENLGHFRGDDAGNDTPPPDHADWVHGVGCERAGRRERRACNVKGVHARGRGWGYRSAKN